LEDQKVMKAFSNAINPGEKLRLRDDVLPLLKRRSWTFAGTGKGNTILGLLPTEWVIFGN
jgi:hypothetical protein